MPKRAVLHRLLETPVDRFFWSAIAVFVLGSVWAVGQYGGLAYWPGLLGNFGASLVAFALALSWDRAMERHRDQRAAEASMDERDRQSEALNAQLLTEARRRLESLGEELRRNKVSVDFLASALASGNPAVGRLLHPELLDAAWHANASRLTQILADYELMSKLASTYGRIEELRWRLRQRTVFMAGAEQLAYAIDRMSKLLIDELVIEAEAVLIKVAEQVKKPLIQQIGRASTDVGVVSARGTATATEQHTTADETGAR